MRGRSLRQVCRATVLLSVVLNQLDAYPVPDIEALRYLASFGYLESRLKNSSTASIASDTLKNAVSEFQSFVGLDPTGTVDEETLTMMRKPRCGLPDRITPEGSSTRRKRNIANEEDRWYKDNLTYRILKYTNDLEKSVVDGEIAKAFRMWEEVTPLTFTFVETGNVDIEISFESGSHSDLKGHDAFDGLGGIVGHASFPTGGGDVHFDEAETWIIDKGLGTNLFQLATHEFGHSLGLNHSEFNNIAVMYPIYYYRSDFKLDTNDINKIQHIYGAKMNETFDAIASGAEINNTWLNEKFKNIASEMRKMENELNGTKKDLEEAKATIKTLKTTLNAIKGDIKYNDGKMPTSCEDLKLMGQKINGIFLVEGTSATIDAVFCDFSPYSNNDLHKWIGHVDVKSSPVYFYVQRNSSYGAFKETIPFDFARVNIGNAMDIQTGIFTAPKSGTYFFSFTGMASFSGIKSEEKTQLEIGLYLGGTSGGRVGNALAEYNTVANRKCPLSLQSMLKLVKHDTIWLEIDVQSTSEVFLFDDAAAGRDGHWTQFTGWMLEEEILETKF